MAEPSHAMIATPAAPAPRRKVEAGPFASSSVGVVIGSGWLLGGLPGRGLRPETAGLHIVDSSSEVPVLDTAQ